MIDGVVTRPTSQRRLKQIWISLCSVRWWWVFKFLSCKDRKPFQPSQLHKSRKQNVLSTSNNQLSTIKALTTHTLQLKVLIAVFRLPLFLFFVFKQLSICCSPFQLSLFHILRSFAVLLFNIQNSKRRINHQRKAIKSLQERITRN